MNIRDFLGRTSLFNAVHSDYSQSVNMLLKTGADVNVADDDGSTLLFQSLSWISTSRLNCYNLLMQEGVKANVTNNHGSSAVTWVLKNQESYTRYRITDDDQNKKEFLMLLLAAGETIDESMVTKVQDYLTPSAENNLKNICREIIRKHLLQLSQVNLFHRVPQLPLPRVMMSYLLHDVTLDHVPDPDEDPVLLDVETIQVHPFAKLFNLCEIM